MKENEILRSIDGTSGQTSTPLDLGDLTHYSIYVSVGGTLAGTLKLFASARTDTAAKYVEVDGSEQVVAAGEDHVYNISNAGYRFVKCVWTYSSGAGNIEMEAVIKENPIKGA